MNIISLLAGDNYVVVNRDLIKELGVKTALMFSELCSEYNYFEQQEKLEDGWFYSTIDNVTSRIGLSNYEQSIAIKALEKEGLIKCEVRGIPATRHIFIDLKKVENKFLKNLKTGFKKIQKLDFKKFDIKSNNIKLNKKVIKDFSGNTLKDDYIDLYEN